MSSPKHKGTDHLQGDIKRRIKEFSEEIERPKRDAAGGLGLFGGIFSRDPTWVREQIRFMRARTSKPFGVGFITEQIPQRIENLRVCLEERVPVFAFSFGDPPPFPRAHHVLSPRRFAAITIPDRCVCDETI